MHAFAKEMTQFWADVDKARRERRQALAVLRGQVETLQTQAEKAQSQRIREHQQRRDAARAHHTTVNASLERMRRHRQQEGNRQGAERTRQYRTRQRLVSHLLDQAERQRMDERRKRNAAGRSAQRQRQAQQLALHRAVMILRHRLSQTRAASAQQNERSRHAFVSEVRRSVQKHLSGWTREARQPAPRASAPVTQAAVAKVSLPKIHPEHLTHHRPDDLTLIDGIGARTQSKLAREGITTFDDLCHTSPARLREILGVQLAFESWIHQARERSNRR